MPLMQREENIDMVFREVERLWKGLSDLLGSAPVVAVFVAAIEKSPVSSPIRRVTVAPQGISFESRPDDGPETAAELHLLEKRVLEEIEMFIGKPMVERFEHAIHAL